MLTRCRRTLLVISGLLLAPTFAVSQQPQTIEELEQLFRDDPASGFEVAWRMFQERLEVGDLDSVTEIVKAARPYTESCGNSALVEEMIDQALRLAEAKVDWPRIGELHWQHGVCGSVYWIYGGFRGIQDRQTTAFRLAEEAYANAGYPLGELTAARQRHEANLASAMRAASVAEDDKVMDEALSPQARTVVLAIREAVGQMRDAAALVAAADLLEMAALEPDDEAYGH